MTSEPDRTAPAPGRPPAGSTVPPAGTVPPVSTVPPASTVPAELTRPGAGIRPAAHAVPAPRAGQLPEPFTAEVSAAVRYERGLAWKLALVLVVLAVILTLRALYLG